MIKNTKQTASDIINALRLGTNIPYKEYIDTDVIKATIKFLEDNYIYESNKQR